LSCFPGIAEPTRFTFVLVGTGESDKTVEIDGEVCETAELVKAALELLTVCVMELNDDKVLRTVELELLIVCAAELDEPS
jgi:hypothetical protein